MNWQSNKLKWDLASLPISRYLQFCTKDHCEAEEHPYYFFHNSLVWSVNKPTMQSIQLKAQKLIRIFRFSLSFLLHYASFTTNFPISVMLLGPILRTLIYVAYRKTQILPSLKKIANPSSSVCIWKYLINNLMLQNMGQGGRGGGPRKFSIVGKSPTWQMGRPAYIFNYEISLPLAYMHKIQCY